MGLTPKEAAARFWDGVYEDEAFVFGTAPNAWFAGQESRLEKGQRILMVADGEGRNSVWCARKGMMVDAFDLSGKAVRKAGRLARENGVSVNFSVNGVDDWQWVPEKYDAVVVIMCQFATPAMRGQMFRNCIRTLKKGGLLFVLGYSTRQLAYGTGGPPWVERLYTEDMLRQYAEGMEILEIASWDEEVTAGRHQGKSALVGMVARKKPVRERSGNGI